MLLEDRKAAYVSIRQHTSAYVSIRQHTSMPLRRQKGIDVLEIVGDDFDEPEEAASKVAAKQNPEADVEHADEVWLDI
jgi:hypothetical protein